MELLAHCYSRRMNSCQASKLQQKLTLWLTVHKILLNHPRVTRVSMGFIVPICTHNSEAIDQADWLWEFTPLQVREDLPEFVLLPYGGPQMTCNRLAMSIFSLQAVILIFSWNHKLSSFGLLLELEAGSGLQCKVSTNWERSMCTTWDESCLCLFRYTFWSYFIICHALLSCLQLSA